MISQDRRRFRRNLLAIAMTGLLFSLTPWDLIIIPTKGVWLALLGRVLLVLPKVGDAMLIAVILTLIVDQAAKATLLKEFALDISGHIIGWHLPQVLRDQLQKYLTLDVIRREWNGTYRLIEVRDHPGFIRVEEEIDSDLENLSGSEQVLETMLEIERSWFPKVGETEIHEMWFDNECFFPDPKLLTKVETDDQFIRIRKKLALPPHKANPEKRYSCQAKSDTFHATNGSYPTFFLYPVLKTTIKVHYPRSLRVNLLLTFGEVEKETVRQDRQGEVGTLIVNWVVSTPILPGQGFVLQWAPQTDVRSNP